MNYYPQLHKLFNSRRRFSFPYHNELNYIPGNGIYILFEKGEIFRGFDRIVRIGSHTGTNQLKSRLNQHYILENKNRSIFRKNIGRCILHKDKDPYLATWELDTTSREDKVKNMSGIKREYEYKIERKISNYIQQNLSFCVFEVNDKSERLFWERKLIATLASFPEIKPSENWLGNYSPKEKIKKYGLWQVNHLLDIPLSENEFEKLLIRIKKQSL